MGGSDELRADKKVNVHETANNHDEIFAMPSVFFNHNVISMNIASDLHTKLWDSSCFVFAGDML